MLALKMHSAEVSGGRRHGVELPGHGHHVPARLLALRPLPRRGQVLPHWLLGALRLLELAEHPLHLDLLQAVTLA